MPLLPSSAWPRRRQGTWPALSRSIRSMWVGESGWGLEETTALVMRKAAVSALFPFLMKGKPVGGIHCQKFVIKFVQK